MTAGEAGASAPRQARDVMAFGQEVGRVLSDGRVAGRAEPFAKVFASSRLVKRAVGLTAWGVLEDIALDASLDAEGRLVAETSARAIAANLGLNKETVTRHLARLREHGFVLHEEVRAHSSGRYETARYVLDPAACLERFTHTPPPRGGAPCTENPDTVKPVYGKPVHGSAGHGGSGQRLLEEHVVVREQQQQPAPSPPTDELCRLGVDAETAAALVAAHGSQRVAAVVAAAERRRPRNPAGWAIAALKGGWDLAAPDPPGPAGSGGAVWPEPAAEPDPVQDEAETARQQRWQAWDAAVSAALDDGTLARAVELACPPTAGMRHVAPVVQAAVIRWAAAAYTRAENADLAAALAGALAQGWRDPDGPDPADLPTPPPVVTAIPAPLRGRLERLVTDPGPISRDRRRPGPDPPTPPDHPAPPGETP